MSQVNWMGWPIASQGIDTCSESSVVVAVLFSNDWPQQLFHSNTKFHSGSFIFLLVKSICRGDTEIFRHEVTRSLWRVLFSVRHRGNAIMTRDFIAKAFIGTLGDYIERSFEESYWQAILKEIKIIDFRISVYLWFKYTARCNAPKLRRGTDSGSMKIINDISRVLIIY